jgi:hypothetical protein
MAYPGAADADLALLLVLVHDRDKKAGGLLAFPRVAPFHSRPPAVLRGMLLLISLTDRGNHL